MRGLPPVPLGTFELVADVDINNHTVSMGFWLAGSVETIPDPTWAGDALDRFYVAVMPNFLALMHEGASFTTCRIATPGFSFMSLAPNNAGEWAGGQADNCASGLHWLVEAGTIPRGPITYVPAMPDIFVDANWRLSHGGYGNLQSAGFGIFNAMNTIPNGAGGFMTFGTVSRVSRGAPRATAAFIPYIGVEPTPKLVTIRRRIPKRRSISPLP